METPTETTDELPADIQQLREDMANMQVIASSLETAKVAGQLKALTHPGQTERIALFDRVIAGAGTPLLNADAPAWNIAEKRGPINKANRRN